MRTPVKCFALRAVPPKVSTPISWLRQKHKKMRAAAEGAALEETMALSSCETARCLARLSCSNAVRAGSRAGQRNRRARLLRQRLAGGAREGAQAVRSGKQGEGPLHGRKLGRQRRARDRGAQPPRRRRRDGRGNDLRPGTRRRHFREARSRDRQEPRQHRAGSQDGRGRRRRHHAGDRLLLPHRHVPEERLGAAIVVERPARQEVLPSLRLEPSQRLVLLLHADDARRRQARRRSRPARARSPPSRTASTPSIRPPPRPSRRRNSASSTSASWRTS